jgi:hypothetical protein
MWPIFKLKHQAMCLVYLWAFRYRFWFIWGCPNGPEMGKKQHKTCFLVVLEISLKRMGLIIWLAAYFKLRHWAILFARLPAFGYFFGPFEGAQMASKLKKGHKNLFSGCIG